MPEPPIPVDLTNCDREPIHESGTIQDFGFLIALSNDFLIARISTNIGDFLTAGDDPAALIGRPLDELLDREAIHDIRNRLSLLRSEDATERLFGIRLQAEGRRFDLSLHIARPGNVIVLEGEPSGQDARGAHANAVRTMMQRLEAARDVEGLLDEGARQVRALMGFDRVMVYRFDEEQSGEVVAESCKGGIGSFKGLHYPASDIPRQARALYKRNLFRIIADVDAEPVPIHPARDPGGHPLDLSMSVLRAVSPIHIEYLKNMGVGASLSISILVEGELWGLIACHHYSPRLVDFEKRSLAELFGQLFAMRLESRLRSEQQTIEKATRDTADRLVAAIGSRKGLLEDPEWLFDLLSPLIEADGMGVWVNGDYALTGKTPSTGAFLRIVTALNGAAAGRIFATDRLGELVALDRDDRSAAAGLLAIPISRQPRDYVVLFREEWIRSVRWAGDPGKPVEHGPNGPRLTPRKSFEAWSELVRGRSEPFDAAARRAGETLRSALIEVMLRVSDEEAGEKKKETERQELLIAELNHRVRNILALIRGLVRQSRPTSGDLGDFIRTVDGRIHALSRAHDQITEDHWSPAPMDRLIEAEAEAYLGDKGDRVIADGPPVLLEPQAYSTIALVLHELVTNSAKYGSLSDSGAVDLTWRRNRTDDLVIDWRERGGPPVREPAHRGFGSTIIERSVPYDLGGEADLSFDESGLTARFVIPGRFVGSGAANRRARRKAEAKEKKADRAGAGAILSGRHILLVEDSLIIAMDAEDIVTKLGARSVAAVSDPAEAIEEIERQMPDFALLDINLGSGNSFAVADALAVSAVPFAFATGFGEQAQLPEAHRQRPVLQKPYTKANVKRLVAKMLG